LPGQHLPDETRNRVGDVDGGIFRQETGAFVAHLDSLSERECLCRDRALGIRLYDDV